MRRLPIIITAVVAAFLSALAVAIATPASGRRKNDGVEEFISCVRAHGVVDAPTDPVAFKGWIGQRLERGDETVKRALEACEGPRQRPEACLRGGHRAAGCLERHGAKITGDGILAVKRWVNEHMDDPDAQDAMKACNIGGPPPEAMVGACGVNAKPAPGEARAKAARTAR